MCFIVLSPVGQKIHELREKKSSKSFGSKMRQFQYLQKHIIRVPALIGSASFLCLHNTFKVYKMFTQLEAKIEKLLHCSIPGCGCLAIFRLSDLGVQKRIIKEKSPRPRTPNSPSSHVFNQDKTCGLLLYCTLYQQDSI